MEGDRDEDEDADDAVPQPADLSEASGFQLVLPSGEMFVSFRIYFSLLYFALLSLLCFASVLLCLDGDVNCVL